VWGGVWFERYEMECVIMKTALNSALHRSTQVLQGTMIRSSVLVAFTLALSYLGGLWLQLLHEADGATEFDQLPPVIHWLRDSTLMLPVVLVSVCVGLFLARWLLQCFGEDAPRILQSAVVVAIIALITSVALGAASPIHNSLFQAHHLAHQHPGDTATPLALNQDNAEMPLALHMVYDGELALVGNLVLSSILFALFRGRLWGMRAVQPIRVSELALTAQPTRS
jgi:hypothetical protein